MSRTWIAAFGLALLVVSALAIYIERHPIPSSSSSVFTAEGSARLALLKEARELPDVGFADGNGRLVKLSSFRGKVVLLNIWATWCVPCRKEMPALDRLQAKLGSSGFEVIALSIDRHGLPGVKEFYLETDIKTLRIYVDVSGRTPSDLGVAAIPTTLLVDQRGREIGRKIGPAEWDSPEIVKLISGYLSAPVPHQPGKR